MNNLYGRALLLGAVCGMRSMLGPALLAERASGRARLLLRVLAVGELVADKLPTTPSRLAPGPLFGRFVSGGAAGLVLCRRAGKPAILGALLGAMGAILGAYGGYHARKTLGERFAVPDPAVAVLEDALAVGIGQGVA